MDNDSFYLYSATMCGQWVLLWSGNCLWAETLLNYSWWFIMVQKYACACRHWGYYFISYWELVLETTINYFFNAHYKYMKNGMADNIDIRAYRYCREIRLIL